MYVLDWQDLLKGPPAPRPAAMTIGVFDGVHRGHQALIAAISRSNSTLELEPTVVTFRKNPRLTFAPERYEGDIFSLPQKLAMFERLGVARTILIDFSHDFSRLSGRDFIGLLHDRGNMAYLVVGAQFRCGYQLDADAAFIKRMNDERGIHTELIEPVLEGNAPVSSSRIRAWVRAGDFATAKIALGRPFAMDLESAAYVSVAPPDGTYLVMAYRHGDGAHTEIRVCNGMIEQAASLSADGFTHIEF
jgi:riboflavin kinase/FMN adenylyltransferase